MDPITIAVLAGLGLTLYGMRKAQPVQIQEPESEGDIGPEDSDLTGLLGGAAAALAVTGVVRVANAIRDRRQREDLRYDNFKALEAIANGIRELGRGDLLNVSDAAILSPLEAAVGVPACVSLATGPSWQRGSKLVMRALADMRNMHNAPETTGGLLPPVPTDVFMFGGTPVEAYYKSKGKRRQDASPVWPGAHAPKEEPVAMSPSEDVVDAVRSYSW